MITSVKIVPDINYNKSIDKGRLFYIRKGWFMLEYMQNAVIFLLIGSMLYVSITKSIGYFFLIISLLMFIYLIFSFLFLNSLIKVKGQEPLTNKENAITTLKHFYKDLTFDASGENILRDVRASNFSGRCITVLFYNESVYFHIATLGRSKVINPVPAIFNYFKCKEIASYFEKLQNHSI
jgi:hypothetical protein